MCRSEFQDRHECKYHPSYEELKEKSTNDSVHRALKARGISLSPTTEEWIKARRKEQ